MNGQARSADEEHSRDGSADAEHTAGEPFSLVDARVAVWGMGPLGERVAALLTALGASVAGIGSAATERGGVQYFQEGTPMAARILERSTLLVACVSGSEALIGGEAFEALGPRGLFVNAGAPAAVDGDGLAVALAAGKLRGAALTGVDPVWRAAARRSIESAAIIAPAPDRITDPSALVGAQVESLLLGCPFANVV